jgi:hypothetical protein
VARFSDRDVRAAFALVWDAAGDAGHDPFPREFLEGLTSWMPADAIGYHEVEASYPCRALEAVEVPAGAGSDGECLG